MPNIFLTGTQKDQYGRYVDVPDEAQLSRYFHLDDADLEHIRRCRGDHNRLGFALQLTTVRFLGTFLADPLQVPSTVVRFLARQLAAVDVDCLSTYGNRKSTWTAHRTVIQRQYEYHEFSTPPWRFRLSRYLYSRAWTGNERPSLMFDYATAWLIQ